MVKRLRRFLVTYRAYAIRPYTFVAITQPKNFGYKVRQSFAYPNAVLFRMVAFFTKFSSKNTTLPLL